MPSAPATGRHSNSVRHPATHCRTTWRRHHRHVETVSTGADKAKLAAAGVLVVGAVVAFYMLGQQDLWLRVAALLGC